MSVITESRFAWEPITPRGVAAFARASLERLIVVQSVLAFIATAAVVWLLSSGFFPTIDAAIRALPATGDISRGKLSWTDESPKILAEGHFLSFSVDTKHTRQLRLPAQFQFEFGEDSLVVISLLGEMELPYPSDQSFYFNRTDLQPAWGAWSPNLLGLAALGTFFGLLLTWALLATVYFLPVCLVAFYTDRDLNFRASWKLAGAALMPGALLLTLGIVLYGFGVFDLVQLGFAFTMHFIIGWIYLLISPLFLNRALPGEKKNPFGGKIKSDAAKN
ncbi:MAG TPA: hypothetical protein VK815_00115 [Candidatus Acidoferrales bacterium]|nr:hypothetical protein [Candidatus Acidoferrales bacterium]